MRNNEAEIDKPTGALNMRIFLSKDRFKEIMYFGITGTTAMIIHYGIYYLLLAFLSINASFSIGYFISFLYNFMMTSYLTFKVRPTMVKFFRFAASHGTNYILQILLLNCFIRLMAVHEKVAPILVYAISIPVNYILVRLAMKQRL